MEKNNLMEITIKELEEIRDNCIDEDMKKEMEKSIKELKDFDKN